MADISKCQDELIVLAEKQGYLTFDDILNASDAFSLSVTEVDYLSEAIQLRGIIVYENAPYKRQESDDEELLDYSRTDYNAIYKEVLTIAPQLMILIEEIKGYPAPQYGEIGILAKQKQEGNRFARERLIKLFMRNVIKIALSMAKQYEYNLEDAISSGFMGLIEAVDRYNPFGFSPLHTYASMWIQQRIQRECNPTWMDYYFPAHYKDKMFRCLQKYTQYDIGGELGSKQYKMVIDQIACETGMIDKEVDEILRTAFIQQYGKMSTEVLMNQEIIGESVSYQLSWNIEDEFKEVFQHDLRCLLEKELASLSEKEQIIIRMRNGMDDNEPKTLEEIGAILGLTRERIRQIEARGYRKLLKKKHKRRFEGYI